jgi:hypothetical protein
MILSSLKFIYDWLSLIVFSLVCLLLIFEYFRKKEISKKMVYACFIIFLIIMAVNLFLYSFIQYSDLKNGSLSKYFLPPYSNYYLNLLEKSITGYAVRLLTGLAVGFLFWFLVRLTKGLVLDIQDVGLLVFGSLIAGWPDVFIFLFFVFVPVVLCNLFLIIIRKKTVHDRFIITPFIPVAIIITIFFGGYLSQLTGLFNIRV